MMQPDGQGSYRIPEEMLRALLPAMQGLGMTPLDILQELEDSGKVKINC